MSLLHDIQASKEGKIVTIPIGHKKLGKYIFMARNMYHLIGGAGGSGKSSWVDDVYIDKVYRWYKKHGTNENIKLKIILRSLERSKKLRIAKWVCARLYQKYGILVDVPYLMGWGLKKSRVSDELFQKITEIYDEIEEMQDVVEIVEGVAHPTAIFYHARDYAETVGTLYYYKKIDGKETLLKRRNKNSTIANISECPSVSIYQPVYVPDYERQITIHINDHLQAMSKESGYNDKQNLDKMSEYSRIMRDLYGMSPVVVNQMNRAISDTMRRIKTELLPEDSDFTGSSQMYSDCDMAGILFNPYKYNLKELKGYNIAQCVDEFGINRFRSYHLLKNTYGPDNQIFGYQFIGENGMFNELPSPETIDLRVYHSIANPKNLEKLTNHV